MKHKYLAAAAVVIITFLTTCKKDNDENVVGAPAASSSVYPLIVGYEWKYYRELHFIDDSTLNDTLLVSLYTIMRNDRTQMLPDSSTAFAFEFSDSTSSGVGLTGTQFYNNSTGGLYHHGYVYGSSGGVVLMPQPQYTYRIGNMESSSIRDLISMIKNGNPSRSDSIIMYNPHKLSIKYPMAMNDEWNFITTPWTINRKYIGDETVSTPFGNFLCKKIEWFYDTNNDSVWDDVHIWQYISPTKGLLKEIFNAEAVYTDINGDTLSSGTLTDESIAISINF
jgi:hypothetical protein